MLQGQSYQTDVIVTTRTHSFKPFKHKRAHSWELCPLHSRDPTLLPYLYQYVCQLAKCYSSGMFKYGKTTRLNIATGICVYNFQLPNNIGNLRRLVVADVSNWEAHFMYRVKSTFIWLKDYTILVVLTYLYLRNLQASHLNQKLLGTLDWPCLLKMKPKN